MKQFIVLISTICLGVLIAAFVLGFKTTAQNLNENAKEAIGSISFDMQVPAK